MARFSITEAALEGFRLTRERPGAVAVWAAVQVVFSVAGGVMMLRVPGFVTLMGMMTSGQQPDVRQLQLLLSSLMPAFTVLVVAALLVDAVLRAGVYRTVLRRGGALGLGIDELRVAVVALATGLLATVPVLVGAILFGLLSAIGGTAGAALGLLLYLASFGLMITVLVRLSLAGPLTVTEGRIRVLSAAKLAHGYGWRLFATYGMALGLYILVTILVGVVEQGVRGVLQIKETVGELNAAAIASMVVQGLVAGLGVAILHAPAAKAYRQITGEPDADVF